jgi:hypothetical protein
VAHLFHGARSAGPSGHQGTGMMNWIMLVWLDSAAAILPAPQTHGDTSPLRSILTSDVQQC